MPNVKITDFEKDIKSAEWLIQMAKQMEVLNEVRTYRLNNTGRVIVKNPAGMEYSRTLYEL